MHRFRKSLTAKLFAAIAGTAGLVIVIMAVLVTISMRDGFSRYLLEGELARFDELAVALAVAHDTESAGWPDLAANPRAWSDFLHAHLSPDTGGPPPPGPPPGFSPGGPPGGPPPAGRDGLMLEERLVLLGPDGEHLAGATEQSGLFEQRPVCASGKCTGAGVLGYIGLNAPLFSETGSDGFFLRRQYASLALAALIAILVSAAAAFLVARQILIPIRRLEADTKRLASGDYGARMKEDRIDELGRLIGHYNALASTLERTAQAERAWISNTSHELQTPLAVMRAQIEALQDGIRQPDAATLAEMHAAVMRLSRLVHDVRTLSHAREAELVTTMLTEDLAEIAGEAVETARPSLEAKGLELIVDLPERMAVRCDRGRMRQVLDNMLQNAGRYTDTPGSVRVRGRRVEGLVELAVDDTPPSAPDSDLPRLFDRFYRAEASRSRVYGGSGLGLSVCKAIVEAHGGTITARRSDMGGVQVVLRVPEGSE